MGLKPRSVQEPLKRHRQNPVKRWEPLKSNNTFDATTSRQPSSSYELCPKKEAFGVLSSKKKRRQDGLHAVQTCGPAVGPRGNWMGGAGRGLSARGGPERRNSAAGWVAGCAGPAVMRSVLNRNWIGGAQR